VATRIGVDVGGTFSDLVVYDDSTGEVKVAKGSTTPASPDEGVARVISEAVPKPLLEQAAFFLHGSTVALNALLERKGAVVGLLTTEGFRDVLELRRGDRAAMNDLLWLPPPPLVPRRLRLGVRERVLADGTVDTPIQEDDVVRAHAVFAAEGVECVAVIFLNAYANPSHELAAEAALRAAGFTGDISLSHRVSGEYHEYERTSTTVIDAYIRPRMAFYLRQLEDTLSTLGFAGSCMITSSGGGAMMFGDAETRPFETIMSGPVAGAVGAGELCRTLGLTTAVTADVGGTSFDTCLIRDGRPDVKYEGSVEGMPIQAPWVDVRSVGAGGGSIAYVDEGGLLRVGPRSAGAEPGPACYRRGGTEPTVTDAAAFLGMLAEGRLAGGVSLDIEAAEGALLTIAPPLGLDTTEVAKGVLTIVNSNMANAIREVTIEQGQDPRDAALIVFGGAGPLFGTLLARELDITRIVVPPHAGNFSAWGLLAQDVTQTVAQTSILPLDGDGLAASAEVLNELFARLGANGNVNGNGAGATEREASLDMRFVGQEYTLTIPVEMAGARLLAEPETLRVAFMREYERTFGHSMDEAVEVVSVRATLRTPLPRREEKQATSQGPAADAATTLNAYSFTQGRRIPFAVVERGSLTLGTSAHGPMIVLEPTATTYVDAGFDVEIHESGTMFLVDGRA
jgi:N-methylhydantoinase A